MQRVAAGAARAFPLLNSDSISSMGGGRLSRPKYYYIDDNCAP